ncbi:cAMP phosphodiesterase [Citrobacter freundii]|nr:cAMP phosphodiesterase [Citrobacter freundii]
MRGNLRESVTGVRLEPVCSLHLNTFFCCEVLSLLAPDVNAEHYFRLMSPDRAAGIFIRQARFIRTLFSSGCFTFNLPAQVLISASLFNSVCHELMPGFIIEIQDPDTVLSLSETDICLLTDSVREIIARGGKVWLDDITPEMTDFFLALQLPLDGVKTDRSILHRISGDDRELISLVEACRQLAPLVVVEGIETAGMQQQARDAGAQAGQGYLWPGKTFLYPH